MVFAGRELATTKSFEWSVVGGFTKACGISGKLKSNAHSIVGDVWRVRMASFSQFC